MRAQPRFEFGQVRREEILEDRADQPVGADLQSRNVARERGLAHGRADIEHVDSLEAGRPARRSFDQFESIADVGMARALGISRPTLDKKLREYGLVGGTA